MTTSISFQKSVFFILLLTSIVHSSPFKNFVFTIGMENENTFSIVLNSKTVKGFQFIQIQKDLNSKPLNIYTFQENNQIISINSISGNKSLAEIQTLTSWEFQQQKLKYHFNLSTIESYSINSSIWITIGAHYDYPLSLQNFQISKIPQTSENVTFQMKIHQKFPGNDDIPLHFIHHIEFYHPVFLGLKITFYLSILVLCVIFRKEHPLKSRGYIPIFSSLLFFCYYTFQIYQFFIPLEFERDYGHFFYGFLSSELLLSLISTIPISYFHFVLLNFLKNQKIEIIQKTDKKKYLFKILKFVTHPRFIMFFIAFQYCVLLLVLSIGIVFKIFTTLFVLLVVDSFLFLNLILIPLGLCLDFYHLILNIKKVKKEDSILLTILKKLIDEDIFYFRIQYYIGIVDMTLISIVSITLYIWCYDYKWIHFSVIYILEFFLFTQQVGGTLIVTIFRKIVNLLRKKTKDEYLNEIKVIINDPLVFEIFYEFAQLEFSIENVECYLDVMKYEKLKPDEREYFANRMFQLYFNGFQSKLEVNVDYRCVKELKLKMEKGEYNEELFIEIRKKLMENLTDTYSRFILSSEFMNYQLRNDIFGNAYFS
jgi:hypothetical protein